MEHRHKRQAEAIRIFTGGAGVIVKDKKTGRVLLGKRTDHQGWCNPGGKRDENESIKECAIRELFEEFGVKAYPDQVEYCGKIFARARIRGKESMVVSDIFKYEVEDATKLSIRPQRSEMSDYCWASFWDFATLDRIYEPSLVALNKFGDFAELSKPEKERENNVLHFRGYAKLEYQGIKADVEYGEHGAMAVIHDRGIQAIVEGSTLIEVAELLQQYVENSLENDRYYDMMYANRPIAG